MEVLTQRKQYAKGGIGVRYWDRRDREIFRGIQNDFDFIFDAGCGEGITLEKLRSRYPDKQLLGMDIDPRKISVCETFGLPVIQGDLTRIGMRDETVDVCILSEVIEHLERFGAVLGELRRIMRENGRLIVVIPNDAVFFIARILCGRFKEAFSESSHVRQWTPSFLIKTLETAGFRTIMQKNIPFPFNRWFLSLHAVIVAEKMPVAPGALNG